MKSILFICLMFCFINLICQEIESPLVIQIGSKLTISLDNSDSINFTTKIENVENYSNAVNTKNIESESLFEIPKTNCIELIFCTGTYSDGDKMTFLFIKNWYNFPIEYEASITPSGNNEFESTSVMPLLPNVLSREDWPYTINMIKLSGFKRIELQNDLNENPFNNSPELKYIGTEKADSAFESLIDIIITNISGLTINQAIAIEQKMESIDITPNYSIELGKDIYPNKNNFKLEPPITFSRIEDSTFSNQIQYFYTKDNGSIKAVFFEWNKTVNSNDLFFIDDGSEGDVKKFSDKFNRIEGFISSKIGEPKKKKIESLRHKDSFRDDVIWESKSGLNVYMFMFGNESQRYRQIRMVIYND